MVDLRGKAGFTVKLETEEKEGKRNKLGMKP